MGTTTNYSWPIPEDTDLVKDGAEAIRDLGNAIDTSAAGFGGGLVHIETQTFSAVSSFNFSNDVFTSTYDNYKIVLTLTSSGNDIVLAYRFRTAGVSDSSANYQRQRLEASSSTVSGVSSTNQTSNNIITSGSAGTNGITLEIYSPKLSAFTSTRSITTTTVGSSNLDDFAGNFKQTTSFDSIEMIIATGTMTGKAILYGYGQ
jgi:hypothetical protein